MTQAARSRPETRGAVAGLVALLATLAAGLLAFLPMLGNTFWKDDFEWVSNAIRATRDPAYLLTPIAMFFRPLVNLTFLVNFQLSRLEPLGYLLFNLAVHLLNAALVAFLARRLAPASRWAGPIAGMLFAAAFGNYGEAVIWICGRTDLLLTTFLLAALHGHLSAIEHGRLRDRLATFGWFVLALLTKESAVVIPPALALLEWAGVERAPGRRGSAREVALRYAPYAAALVPYLLYEWALQRHAPAVSEHHYGVGWHALRHWAEYLVRMWVPVTPSSMMVAVPAHLRGALDVTIRVLMGLIPLGWLALLFARVPRPARFGILFMLVSVVPFSLFTWRITTRYLYTPSVGWVLAMTFLGLATWRVLVGAPVAPRVPGGRAAGRAFPRPAALAAGLVILAIALATQTVVVHYVIRQRHEDQRRQDPADLRAMTELARSLGY